MKAGNAHGSQAKKSASVIPFLIDLEVLRNAFGSNCLVVPVPASSQASQLPQVQR
jgi:hypothetical protein